MMSGWHLLASATSTVLSVLDQRLVWTFLAMAGAVALGALIITWVNRWRRKISQEDTANDQLASFRQLYERGELSQEEYDRVRQRLSQRFRQEINLPPPGAPTPPAQPTQPPAAPPPSP